jgi:hypothetical protein
MQLYSDPTREAEMAAEPGWYWWACFPGCLPDGEAFGPYETEAEAQESANAESFYVGEAFGMESFYVDEGGFLPRFLRVLY